MVLKSQFILELVQHSQLLRFKLRGRTVIWPQATGNRTLPTLNSKAESLPNTPNKCMVTSSSTRSRPNSYSERLVSMVSCRQVRTCSASSPSSRHACLVVCSRHYCGAVSALGKPCRQGALPHAKHCSAKEAMYGGAAQLWAWIDQIQDWRYLYLVLFPARSRKTYGRGMKGLHTTSPTKPHVRRWH